MTPHTPPSGQAAAAKQQAQAEFRMSQIEMFLHAALIGGMVDQLEARSAPQHAGGAGAAAELALLVARTGQPNATVRQAARTCHALLRDAIATDGLPLHLAVERVQQTPSGSQAFNNYLRALVPEAFAAQGGRA